MFRIDYLYFFEFGLFTAETQIFGLNIEILKFSHLKICL